MNVQARHPALADDEAERALITKAAFAAMKLGRHVPGDLATAAQHGDRWSLSNARAALAQQIVALDAVLASEARAMIGGAA